MSEREEALAFYHHIDLQEMKSYALTYSQMENLSSHDAFTLFKHNYYRMSLFRRVLIMSSNELLTDFYRYFFAFGEMNRSQNQDIDFVLTKISENDNNYFSSCKPHDANTYYDVFYKPFWATNLKIEMEHRSLFNSIYQWYQDAKAKDVSNKVDRVLFVLTMQVLLLNSSELKYQLNNRKYVEEAQQKYASMLHYYLKCHHPENIALYLPEDLC